MSSAKYARVPLTPSDQAALVHAVSTVCDVSFFAFAEPGTPAAFEATLAPATWYEVDVSFDGPFNGRFRLALQVPLAHELVTAFLGCADDDQTAASERAMRDAVGEFGNMTCGAWLTALGGPRPFTIERPDVRLTGEPLAIGATLFTINDQPVVVGIELRAEVA
jgi:chemotaxis phosphatase CheX-like protein